MQSNLLQPETYQFNRPIGLGFPVSQRVNWRKIRIIQALSFLVHDHLAIFPGERYEFIKARTGSNAFR